jgi:hypothetical protein
VTALLGMPRQVRPQHTYESLAEALAASLPEPLAVALGRAIGIAPEQSRPPELPEPAETYDDQADNRPLLNEMMVDDHGSVTPSLIARARLFDAVMLNRDVGFKQRFDATFGEGSSDRVLSGR